MKLLFDLNVWIDIAARPERYPDSLLLLREVEAKGHVACLPLCGYTTIYYVLSQILSVEAASNYMRLLQARSVRMLSFTPDVVTLAQTLPFEDHEDACVAATGLKHSADIIVTRDLADFSRSPVKALDPSTALELL